MCGIAASRSNVASAQETKALASERNRDEKEAAAPAPMAKEAERVTTTPAEIMSAYLTNTALVDEKFVGKRVAVTGTMARIKSQRIRQGLERVYLLEMRWEGQKPDQGKSRPAPPLMFQFAAEERKSLARLKEGQRVTVEGMPREPAEGDVGFILFDNCKIINSTKE